MADYIAIIGIVASVLLAIVMLLLGVVGWFVAGRLKSIDTSLHVLPVIQVELAGLKAKVDYQSERQNEFCERLQAVEQHVSNTERIAVMEKAISMQADEIRELRLWRHSIEKSQVGHI